MVLELQRISLLWDELWIGTIQQYGAEINRRVKKMEDEVKRLNVNQNLSEAEKKSLAKEKYNIVFKPLLYVFEKVRVVGTRQYLSGSGGGVEVECWSTDAEDSDSIPGINRGFISVFFSPIFASVSTHSPRTFLFFCLSLTVSKVNRWILLMSSLFHNVQSV